MPARCLIGTSGWSYRHWRGPFYPSGMAKGGDQLRFYAERFDTVEVNGTFYRLIETDTFRRWREATPAGFVFACKGSRYLTHMKRLKEPDQGVARFFERVEALGDKLGPIVFQLPGRFKPDRERLVAFLEALPAGRRYAFEFRDPAWFEPEHPGGSRRGAAPRSACTSSRASRRRSRSPPTSSTSACTAREARTRARTATRRCEPGPSASAAGLKPAATSTATSTMTTAAMRRTMPCACGTCWREVASSSCPRV